MYLSAVDVKVDVSVSLLVKRRDEYDSFAWRCCWSRFKDVLPLLEGNENAWANKGSDDDEETEKEEVLVVNGNVKM